MKSRFADKRDCSEGFHCKAQYAVNETPIYSSENVRGRLCTKGVSISRKKADIILMNKSSHQVLIFTCELTWVPIGYLSDPPPPRVFSTLQYGYAQVNAVQDNLDCFNDAPSSEHVCTTFLSPNSRWCPTML